MIHGEYSFCSLVASTIRAASFLLWQLASSFWRILFHFCVGVKRQNIVYFEMDTASLFVCFPLSLFLPSYSSCHWFLFLSLMWLSHVSVPFWFIRKCWHLLLTLEEETLQMVRTTSFFLHHPHKHIHSFSVHHPHVTSISSSWFTASPIALFRTYIPVLPLPSFPQLLLSTSLAPSTCPSTNIIISPHSTCMSFPDLHLTVNYYIP